MKKTFLPTFLDIFLHMFSKFHRILGVGFGIIVILGTGLCLRSRPVRYVNRYILPDFSFTEPADKLPDEKRLPWQKAIIKAGTFTAQDDRFIIRNLVGNDLLVDCEKVGQPHIPLYSASIIEYFRFSPGYGYGFVPVAGGGAERYAVVCDRHYLIVDAAGTKGFELYGPFERK